jgi:hypothetical protein
VDKKLLLLLVYSVGQQMLYQMRLVLLVMLRQVRLLL